jgi:hypothetical protein
VCYKGAMRVGLLDIVAATALFVAAVLPSPSRPVKPVHSYSRDGQTATPTELAEAQAEVARDPQSGGAAARLSELLVRARQTDWAVRAAVRPATGNAPDRWRALVALSAAFVDRLEIRAALEWAVRAVEACDAEGAACADHQHARLAMYHEALRAAFDSRIDPKVNRKGFAEAAARAVPIIRVGR